VDHVDHYAESFTVGPDKCFRMVVSADPSSQGAPTYCPINERVVPTPRHERDRAETDHQGGRGTLRVSLPLLPGRQVATGRRGDSDIRQGVFRTGDRCLRFRPRSPVRKATTFEAAAELLVETEYADACPIAAIALEVASTDEPLRVATAAVFNDWIESGTQHFADSGLSKQARRRVTISIITGLEGAFVLCRALRSTEPLEVAGQSVLHAARVELLR
jgi:hypothetical protein